MHLNNSGKEPHSCLSWRLYQQTIQVSVLPSLKLLNSVELPCCQFFKAKFQISQSEKDMNKKIAYMLLMKITKHAH